MDIILLERVKSLGEMGAIVSVKPGYARNFLLPNKKALRATEENKSLFAARKAELEAQNEEKLEKAQSMHAVIDKHFVTVIRQAGEDGKLFGSVSARDIADGLNSHINQPISYSEVVMKNPIKYIGIHEISVMLHSDLQTILYVNVARTESEAEETKKEFLSPPKRNKSSSEE